MTWEDQVFIANVVVINSMWETVVLNVISQPSNTIMKLSAIVNIYKYRRLHEGHHFISMAMEVHGTPKRYMDCFIKECAHFFSHNKRLTSHLSLSFCIQFSDNMLILLFIML